MFICGGILLPLVGVIAAATSSALDTGLHNAQGINFWMLHHRTATAITSQQHPLTTPADTEQQAPFVAAGTAARTAAEAVSGPVTHKFRTQTFTQPLDHFRNTTDATFEQRFWVNAHHYKPRPGVPVIVIDGGETSGEDRLPFLDTGIADLLARATGGVGVVLEHRYYGACSTHVSLRSVLSLLRAWMSRLLRRRVHQLTPGFQASLSAFRTCRRTLSGARIILRIAFSKTRLSLM
jgi:hypothetical protein